MNTLQLPVALQNAQNAVATPRVQEIIKELEAYNLGVCMPHRHGIHGQFESLPDDLVQVEAGQAVDFLPSTSVDHSQSLPVAWRSTAGQVVVCAVCSDHELCD